MSVKPATTTNVVGARTLNRCVRVSRAPTRIPATRREPSQSDDVSEVTTTGDETDRRPTSRTASRRAVLSAVAAGASMVKSASVVEEATASPVRASMRAADRTPSSASAPAPRASAPGYATLRDASNYHGLATTDRRGRALEGLLPPNVVDDDVEVLRAREALKQCRDGFESYKQLVALQLTDEKTFYKLLRSDPENLLPLLYTPTVGEACIKFGTLVQRPLGVWVSLKDAGGVRRLVQNWPANDVKIAVITDGERILGLGDQGANGMGISAGKSMVYAACGLPPTSLLPIQIDTGTNNKTLLDDPLYIGLKSERDRSKAYDDLLDETVAAIRDRYGPNTIIHWEDFAPRNAFRVLRKFQARRDVVTYNDDIQGTAAVTVSGLLASVRALDNGNIADQRVLFFGAGQANCGAAELFVRALVKRGIDEADARKRIWLFDSKGLVTKSRFDSLSEDKRPFAQDAPELKKLEDAVDYVKPTALIGAAAVPAAFSETVVRKMSALNRQPIIFALSNPTSKAECTAEQAYAWSDGRAIFASGTKFAPVKYGSRTFAPGFANNAFIFPPIALGAIVSGANQVSQDMFLAAAESLAESVESNLLDVGAVYPPVDRIADSALNVAAAVATTVDPSVSSSTWRTRINTYIRTNDIYDSL